MDINELESFNMADAVAFHEELNPKLWENEKLDPEVRDQLLLIAEDFVEYLGISNLKVRDVTLSGSNAAYSYTPHSDLDLHVLVDFNELPNNEVYQELFTAKKTLYNDAHDITVRDVPVELYVQDTNNPVQSLGEYSIVHDKWIRIPKKRRANFDQAATKLKYEKLGELIELALKTKDPKRVNDTIALVKRYRKSGLDKAGEFGPENLAYKAVRKQGLVQALHDLKVQLHTEKLSIDESDDEKEATLKIQKHLNKKYGANLDLDGKLGPLTLKSINKFMPRAKTGLADEPNKTTAVQGKKLKEAKIAEAESDVSKASVVQFKTLPGPGKPRHSFRVVYDGKVIAYGEVEKDSVHDDEHGASVQEIVVHNKYRRMGIASKIYSAIERKFGYKLHPSDDVRPDGQEFWKARSNIDEASDYSQYKNKIENFVQSLNPDDVGVEEIGPYHVHFEGFTDECQQDAERRCNLPSDNPRHLANYDDVYKEVIRDFVRREGGKKPLKVGFAGYEDYPVMYAVFDNPEPYKKPDAWNPKMDEAPRTFQPQTTPIQELISDYNYFTSFGTVHLEKQGKTPEAQKELLALVQRLQKDAKVFGSVVRDKKKMEANRDTILTHIHQMMTYAIPILKKNLPADDWEAKRGQINSVLTSYNNVRQINEASELNRLDTVDSEIRKKLNDWMDQDQRYNDPTQRVEFQAKVWPYIQKNLQTIFTDKGEKGDGDYPAAPFAAWLLVQHMDAFPQNQIEFYNALKQAIPNHPKIQFLRDRAAVNQWIMKNANNPEYFYKGKPLSTPTVNVRNPAMFKDAGIKATSREEALDNAKQAGNKLLVAAVNATNAQTQPSYTQGVNESSGYIPSAKEKNDPRFKTALTVDVKPDAIKKNAKAFGFKTSRAGIPPQTRADGKIAEDLMREFKTFLGEQQEEMFPGYDEQHREKRLGNWLAKSWGVKNGKPQTFYHATTKDFDTFNTSGTGFASALGMAYEVERHGSFFAVDPKFAEGFIEDPNTGRVKEGGRVLPVHLSIQSPIDLRDDALSRMLSDEETVDEFKANDIDLRSIYNHFYELERWELFDGPEGAEFIDNLQKLGFDGAIINEAIPNNSNAKSGQVWVAFSPNQVKSVYNRGSFSPDDARLTKESG